ncbi:MAG TPA: hypothetical protein VEJ36_02545 [Nitrososphaerales archaeon]|nr:hypothetical protein [Nitrososphaerales archaeon]
MFGLLTAVGTTIDLLYSGVFSWTEVAEIVAALIAALIIVSFALILKSFSQDSRD